MRATIEDFYYQISPLIKSHLGIILLALFVLGANLFISRANAYYQMRDLVYLEPESASQMIASLGQYTPSIEEDFQEIKLALVIAENEEYLQKSDFLATEGTKLEKQYLVEGGDTITGIAKKFNLHVATIVDRNGLNTNNIESLKPGQKLIIPSKDTSDSQDWLAQLNEKKEKERQRALAAARRTVVVRDGSSRSGSSTKGARLSSYQGNNPYPYGWCTYYAASRRNVPGQWGNAGRWLSSAQRAGYATGSAPQAGAIIVTRETWAGHVGYVESVDGDSVTISEMNYAGWGVVSRRTINTNSGIVKGYIY